MPLRKGVAAQHDATAFQEAYRTARRSVYGAVVCWTCHPPADAALVAVWEGGA
jgi:hypothetical protein